MRNLAKGLKRANVDVAIAPEEYHNVGNMPDWEIKEMIQKPHDYWNRVVLRSSEGDHMYLMPPGKRRIAHTTGESSYANKEWIQQLNAVDLVLTTSNFYANVLKSCGLLTPVAVLPNSVNFDIYNRDVVSYKGDFAMKGFNFFSMFHYGERKAPDILVKAFMEEFRVDEDVSLTIHSLSIGQIMLQAGTTVENWVRSLSPKSHASIYVSESPLYDEVMPHYLKGYDCFVLPTRGEGFGLPVLECGAMGIPAIVTGYSGVLDLVDDKTGWFIDYDLVDIPLQTLTYFKNYVGGKWAQPSINSLRERMRYAFEHRDEVKQKGEAMYKKALEFSIDKIGQRAKDIIFSR
jgi:glycosyltransferase involved in cell wall biosynthesis